MPDEKIEIIEVEEEKKEDLTVEAAKEAGLRDEEIAMAKAHGLIKEPEEPAKEPAKKPEEEAQKPEEKKPEDKKLEEKKQEEQKEEAKPEPIEDNLDDNPEKELERIKAFNANEKALYFKQKKEKRKRQFIERELELTKVKLAAYEQEKQKPPREDEAEDELDLELGEGKKPKEKYITQEELDRREKEKIEKEKIQRHEADTIRQKLIDNEQEAKTRYPDFDNVMEFAKEMIREDKTGAYALMLSKSAADPESDTAEFVYKLGTLHPKYKKAEPKKEEAPKEEGDTKKVEKIVNNANKRLSSATLGGSTGTARFVSEEDLTLEDTKHMNTAQWNKLKKETRERLLYESCKT